ncbi:MAG: alpha/beta hydrolase [Crocinitomicaceae bacterium]|nr:alpha/beta hydrolase [Crocinitomicaceae bacterium]
MLNHKVAGKGTLIVFLHGFLESMEMWKNISNETIGFKKLLIDLPGHGESSFTPPLSDPCLSYPVKEILSLINSLDIDRYHVVGHSLGGYVALRIKEEDARCEKVVLLNSNNWEDNASKKKDRIRVADLVFKSKNLFINQAVPSLFSNPKKNKVDILNLIKKAKTYSSECIAYYSLAMRNRKAFSINDENYFMIHGEFDETISKEELNKAKLMFKTRLYFLKTGHMSAYESPVELNKILCQILVD